MVMRAMTVLSLSRVPATTGLFLLSFLLLLFLLLLLFFLLLLLLEFLLLLFSGLSACPSRFWFFSFDDFVIAIILVAMP